MIFGADPKTLYASVMSPVFLVGPIAISHWDLRALAVTVSLALALAAFLRFTKDGQFLSAVADNSELAEVYGIGLNRAYAISMVLAAVLVVAGMYLVGTRLPMYPATPLNQFLILPLSPPFLRVSEMFSQRAQQPLCLGSSRRSAFWSLAQRGKS